MLNRIMSGTVLAVIGALVVYFGYHGLAGEYGLARWTRLQAEEARLNAELRTLTAERDRVETRLARLRDATLDPDYLEEVARIRLAFARPDEVLVAIR